MTLKGLSFDLGPEIENIDEEEGENIEDDNEVNELLNQVVENNDQEDDVVTDIGGVAGDSDG